MLKQIDVLFVEDNPGDIRLTIEAFKEAKLVRPLHVCVDGVQAMEFLRRQGVYAEAPRPDIILLDLNLPRKDGMEVLAEVKADARLRRIPVIILTTSEAEQDIVMSYDLHANAYVTKPVDMNDFVAAVRSLKGFWSSVVLLPEE